MAIPRSDAFSLTARAKTVLLEPKRFTVLLPALPEIAGRGALAAGEHRLESLRMSAEGYDLKIDAPVTVSVEPRRIVVRMGG